MLVDIVLAVLLFYFSIPLIAGYFAYSYGRSFWTWFLVSTFLPIITHFVLLMLVLWDERKVEQDKLNRRETAESERIVKQLIEEIEDKAKDKSKT